MRARLSAAVALLVLAAALGVSIALTVPWTVEPTPPSGPAPVTIAPYFTAAQLARENAFHAAIAPGSYGGLGVGLVVAIVLGFTPLGARVVSAVARPLGGSWVWQALLGSVALGLIGQVAVVPFQAYSQTVLRRYGLSTEDWASWAGDVAKSFGINVGVTALVVLAFYAIVRAAPRTWWAWCAAAGAALVVVASFLYPVVIEPAFNNFHPLAAGPLRSSLLALAHQDHVPVDQVLVSDASRRTTELNAYVSGFGASRRIVLYDTLLKSTPPDQIRVIVAHELGHAKNNDVLHGTWLGALGVATGICLLYLVITWPPLLRRSGARSLADTRSVGLLLALVAVGSFLFLPVENLVSRHFEARADAHSLHLTRDPQTFITMQKSLAVTNLSNLDPGPFVYVWFFTHPTPPARIALARTWERLQ